ncbi:MAG: hypothetical protein HY321_10545, partial [Armatimonadetes bacterium]|nr:hypothetical protein [Armatimonadota bacterium]
MTSEGTSEAEGAPAAPRGRGRRAWTALLVAAPAILWFQPLLRGRVLLAGITPLCDQWHLNVPFAFLLSESLRAGRLPLWTDRIGGGYPLHALGEAGVLYPPHLLLYALLPPLLAYGVNTLLAIVVAHGSMYLFCRDLGRSRAASLLAGLAYSFSGYFVVHLPTLHSAQSAAWVPLLLLAVRRAVASHRPGARALVGVVLAIQITAGYPQVVYYSVVAAALWGAWECGGVEARRHGGVGVWGCGS